MKKNSIVKLSLISAILILATIFLAIYLVLQKNSYADYEKGIYFRKTYAQVVESLDSLDLDLEYFNVKGVDESNIQNDAYLILADESKLDVTIDEITEIKSNELYAQKRMHLTLSDITPDNVYEIRELEIINGDDVIKYPVGKIRYITFENKVKDPSLKYKMEYPGSFPNRYYLIMENRSVESIYINFIDVFGIINFENYELKPNEEIEASVLLDEIIATEEEFDYDGILLGGFFQYTYNSVVYTANLATHAKLDYLKSQEAILDYLKNVSDK